MCSSDLQFETAGSGAGQANDMHLTGIIDAHNFRNRILEARDALKHQQGHVPAASVTPSQSENAFMAAQLAALHGIERRLDEALVLLRERK